MKRAVAVLVVLVTAATLGSLQPSDAVAPPSIEPTDDFIQFPCPEGVFPDDRDVDCGFVEVPEDRDEPDGRLIRVAAAVVHASDPSPAPDPIVFVNGGPSFGAISDYALGAYFAGAKYADDHDLVLVDTRGTGMSRPRLGCRELDHADYLAWYAGSFIYDDAPRLTGRALDRCWERLTGRGIDLADYNSAESAADLDALRQALGVDEWNLMALSADGTLGLTYLRLFPDGIRSAVIDSAIPSNVEWGTDFLRGETALARRVLTGCRANTECRATYPGLRRKFFRTVSELNEHPIKVRIPAFRPEPVAVPVDGGTLVTDFAYAAWPGGPGSRPEIHDALAVAWQMVHGGIRRIYRQFLGAGPYDNQHRNDYFAMGKSMSYICRDLVGFVSMADRRRAAEADPPHARRILGRQWDLGQGWNNPTSPEGCEHWPVGRADPVQNALVVSDVPALVLSGTYDVVVPPLAVERMLPGLSEATYVEMPTSAHVVLAAFTRANWCARRITRSFLTAPEESPDTSCLADIRPIDFTPPRRSREAGNQASWHRGLAAWLPYR